jgi:hypothetical protein
MVELWWANKHFLFCYYFLMTFSLIAHNQGMKHKKNIFKLKLKYINTRTKHVYSKIEGTKLSFLRAFYKFGFLFCVKFDLCFFNFILTRNLNYIL